MTTGIILSNRVSVGCRFKTKGEFGRITKKEIGRMETKKGYITALVVLGLVSGIAATKLQAVPEANSVSLEKLPYTFTSGGRRRPTGPIVFEGAFPKLPKMMMVYKVKDQNVTEASVRKFAEQYFNMPADAELKRSKGMGLYWLRSEDSLFEVDPANGSFNIDKIGEDRPETWVKENYPSKEECRKIAEEYLKSRNLLSEDAYFRGIADNIHGSGVMSLGFGRLIGGYKSWGPGAQILVHIGLGGEVVGVRKAWQELIPYKPYPVKSPEEALEELGKGNGVLMHGSEGKVGEMTFRYCTSPRKQEYVQPAYYFDCNRPDGSFYGVVPAIKAEYLKPREWGRPGDKGDKNAGGNGQPRGLAGLMIWVKCRNPQCQAGYKMRYKDYLECIEKHGKEHPETVGWPPVVCQKCGQKSVYLAVKCEKCGFVFEAGWKDGDYSDRCPKCGFSKMVYLNRY